MSNYPLNFPFSEDKYRSQEPIETDRVKDTRVLQ